MLVPHVYAFIIGWKNLFGSLTFYNYVDKNGTTKFINLSPIFVIIPTLVPYVCSGYPITYISPFPCIYGTLD